MKKLTVLLLLAALSLQLFACTAARPDTPDPSQATNQTPSQTNGAEPASPTGLSAAALSGEGTPAPVDGSFAAASANFAVELLKNTVKSGENAILSPYSVLTALAMTANGADGETRAQMEAAFGLSIDKLNAYLLTCAQNASEEFSSANAIWLRDGLEVSESFLQTDRDYYASDVHTAAFDEETCRAINEFVKKNTQGRIEKILEEINPNAVMYLVNALAFTAKWNAEYTTDDVRPETFHGADGDVQAELMYSTEHQYLSDENTTGFLKSYRNTRFCYVALLPAEGTSLDDYIASLTGEKLNALMQNVSNERVNAVMPKFKAEYSTELSTALQAMGMTDAFGDKADFSRMSPQAQESGLCIGSVLHKTFLQVNETGTEAAAATAVEVMESTAIQPQKPKTVRVDRPFVCGIYDTESQTFLFLGAVYDV